MGTSNESDVATEQRPSKAAEYEERRERERAISMAQRSWWLPLLVIPVAIVARIIPFVGLINIVILVCSVSALIRSYSFAIRKGWDGLTVHIVLGTILNVPIIVLFVLLLVGAAAMLSK